MRCPTGVRNSHQSGRPPTRLNLWVHALKQLRPRPHSFAPHPSCTRIFCPTGKSVKTCPAPLRKIFRFPRRANQRYQLAPSFPGKRGGRASSRTWEGMRWTRQRRRATVSQGESLVSDQPACRRTALIPPSLKLRRTGTKPVEAFGVDGCVRQNRVVPTPVAGVKLSVATSIRPDRSSHQAGSDGDKTNSSPGRARHKP
jgi:hypothetical protein